MQILFVENLSLKSLKSYKVLLTTLITLTLLLLITVITAAVFYFNSKICTSDECLRSAANLRWSMDLSADPCEDFHQFTCGDWSKEHLDHKWFNSFSDFLIISERILIESENILKSKVEPNEPSAVSKAKYFYQSCVDTDTRDKLGFSVIFRYLQEVGLPPVPSLFTKTDEEVEDFKFDWLKTDVLIKKTFDTDAFIGFSVIPDVFNNSENLMYIGKPRTKSRNSLLAEPGGIFNNLQDVDSKEKKRARNSAIIRYVLPLILKNVTLKDVDENKLEEAVYVLTNMTFFMDELIQNYTNLLDKVPVPHSQNIRIFEKKTNDYLRKNLNMSDSQIWEKYVGYLFENTNVTIHFDKDEFHFNKLDENFLPRIVSYVLSTPDVYLELYMWWISVGALLDHTTSDYARFMSKQIPTIISRPRSISCTAIVNKLMGMAVGYEIGDRNFSLKTKPKLEQMLHYLKGAFEHNVDKLTWIDKETKEIIFEKNKAMNSFIGHPDWLFNKNALNAYYKEITINKTTYLDNWVNFFRGRFTKELQNLRKFNKKSWEVDPTVVNAFNDLTHNRIVVPMGIVSFPFFNLGLEVLHYGTLGVTLGHELIHGFDDKGIKFDKFGNYKKWWANSTLPTFQKKVDCFVKQYENFTFEEISSRVNGIRTLEENLADNGGIHNAFAAYLNYVKDHGPEAKLPGYENFTSNQLFFISFANSWCSTISREELKTQLKRDVHSPSRIRVVASLQNSKEFARAFKCPLGSKMNPVSKCILW